nr:hypothetical protein [Streptomyces atratus]
MSRVKYSVRMILWRVSAGLGGQAGEDAGQGALAGDFALVREDRAPLGYVRDRGDVLVRDAMHAFSDIRQQRCQFADAAVGVGGHVQGLGLPGVSGFRVEAREACGFAGEEGDLVGAAVVRVACHLAEYVVGGDDVRSEAPQVVDEPGDGLVERRVDETRPAGSRGGVRASA